MSGVCGAEGGFRDPAEFSDGDWVTGVGREVLENLVFGISGI